MALSWQQILRTNFRDFCSLASFLEFTPEQCQELFSSSAMTFPCNVPQRLAKKMEKGNPKDPLFLQLFPTQEEERANTGCVADPCREEGARPTPFLLHKYSDRCLLLPSSACAMHCRYCFRKAFPYGQKGGTFVEELDYIRQRPEIEEVILSGGDPLSLSNRSLDALLTDLDSVEHLKRIRFHTRFPLGIPERIDQEFLEVCHHRRCQLYLILHCNHPRELDEEVVAALKKILRLGIPLLNQAVLLRGVNDREGVQEELARALVNGGILPYYLHLLDPVLGTAHFAVSEERGRELLHHLQAKICGYALPRLAREEAGKPSKRFGF